MSVFERAYTERDGSEFEMYENVTVEYREASHRYWLHLDGGRFPVPSVTGILKVLDRPALARWIEDQATRGAVHAERLGELAGVHEDDWLTRVRSLDLGASAKREAGADRGTAVHRVLEFWAREQEVPNLSDFDASVRGYVQGLCAWLLAANPKPTSIERFVGSRQHMYAGRLDLRAVIDRNDTLIDLKTSKNGRAYPEAHIQAQAYATADIECGSPPPREILIVAVGEDGGFEQVTCEAEAGDWLNVLATYRSMVRLRNARTQRDKMLKAAA